MPSYFSVSFPDPVSESYSLEPDNTGGQDLGFSIKATDPIVDLIPNEIIKYMIKPNDLVLTSTQISGILSGQTVDNRTTGQYFTYIENTTDELKTVSYPKFKFPSTFENTEFTLHWLHQIKEQGYSHYGENIVPVFSFPHNIQASEVKLSGKIGTTEKTIDYTVTFPALLNEGSSNYSGSNLPYVLFVQHQYPDNSEPYNMAVDGFTDGPIFYPSGYALNGISFTLPFYDNRDNSEILPAKYTISINYNSAGSIGQGSTAFQLNVDHENIKDKFLIDLDAVARSSAKIEDLHYIKNINIPANIINRKRLAIGIEDIKTVERIFEKTGMYVSHSTNLDFGIYTFSLNVDEYIPVYNNINSFDTVKYFVEFNNAGWIRISPINRDTETENDEVIPKILIFDNVEQNTSVSNVKYINISSIANNFRIKIVFDMSSITNSTFVPPEVHSYKCIIFDKDHFANFEG